MPPGAASTTTKYLIGISGLAVVASAGRYAWQRHRQQHFSKPATNSNMAVTTPFQTLFAVPMHCDSCVKDISGALHQLQGITKVEANLEDQLVSIEGTAPPSAIVEAIQATGRDAILRGSGASNSAAVSILETFHQTTPLPQNTTFKDRHVRGLARLVQVSPTTTLLDLTLRGVSPGTYRATIREYGNLAEGASSTGPVWAGKRGFLGTVQVGMSGHGSVFVNQPFQIWEVIGHAMVVTRQEEEGEGGKELVNDEDTVVGVVARSAGMWDNEKTVCSCTGKTLWEERKDEVGRGML